MTSTVTTQHPERHPAPSRSAREQWARVAAFQLIAQLIIGAWFFGVALVLGAIAMTVLGGRLQLSVAQAILSVAFWFPFGVSISLTVTYLRVFVAAGVSRRSFVRGALAATAGTALAFALVGGALLALEGPIYAAFGWSGAHVGLDKGITWTIAGLVVGFAITSLCGVLVGATYLRFGAWATLLLPLTVLAPFWIVSAGADGPHIGFFAVVRSGSILLDGTLPGAGPIGVLVVTLTFAVVAAAAWLTLRRVPLPPRP